MAKKSYKSTQITLGRVKLPIVRLLVVIVFLSLVSGYLLTGCSNEETKEDSKVDNSNSISPNLPDLPSNLNTALEKKSNEPDSGEFANFSHRTEYHQKLPCLSCHVRDNNAARISMPGKLDHSPCAGCHTLQFENPQSSMCTICHTDPDDARLKSFPRLRSFGVKFSHAKHMRTNCSTCHKPSRRSAVQTIPAGRNAHTTCFACHTSNARNTMASCGLCHEPGRQRIRVSTGSKAFAVNFSHRNHRRVSCSGCHVVTKKRSLGNQVTSPIAAMHFARRGVKSCATCHDNRRAFGGDDFKDCKRCHTGSDFNF